MRVAMLVLLGALAAHETCAAGAAEPAPVADWATGQKLYTGKCARCHRLYDPTRYSDAEWEVWMGKMRRKSRLNEEQYQLLSAYLESLRQAVAAPQSDATAAEGKKPDASAAEPR